MKEKFIETINLTKFYDLKKKKNQIRALNNVNISIKECEIFGLLGPNGAGKTTLVSILTTLLQPTSGDVYIDGINIVKNPKNAKSKVSLMLDSQMLYLRITAFENLKFFCNIYRVPNYEEKINKMVKEFELERWMNEYVYNLSTGMKMKLALLRTFLLDRPILFLDEPTVGLDIKFVSFIVDKIKKSNKTIFLTSHDMSVIEKLCDRIAFINKGELLKIGSKDDIKQFEKTEINVEIKIKDNIDKLKNELLSKDFIKNVSNEVECLIASIYYREDYNKLLTILGKYNILKIKEIEPTLENLFLRLM